MKKIIKNILTLDEVEHIAKLARIELSGQEKIGFSRQLATVLDYVNQLNKVDTSGVEPTSHVSGLINIMRSDKAESSKIANELIEEAPEKEKKYVKVRMVLKGNK